jgi:glutathione peroxidase
MRTLPLVAALFLVCACGKEAKAPQETPRPKETPMTADLDSIWQTPIKTLDGQPTTLGAFKGKELLVVNVASKCGLTPQYAQLEALQKKYEGQGFTVVGFPCNQFGGQEPGSAEEIQEFCSTTYGVTFPMMEKVEVNGAGRHPIYDKLTKVADGSGHTGDIRWNFEKFVISADGKTITRFSPKTVPDDPAVVATIEKGLPR